MSSLLGTTLGGRYRLESRVGSGGMSTVYRAHDETLERWVAIKLMHREIAADSDQLERFRREARAVARLSHPNVVGVIDAGEDEGRPYIVFEYVEGETLKDRIRRLGKLPIPETVAYSIAIARALGAAHARHIVHRDVKPQNVLIDEEGTAKVTDFGIARTLEEQGLTDDGRVLGTTDYVSPEQALGQPVTGQSDLYSLGVAMYEMLTGELPFSGETQVAVAMKHVRQEFPDVRVRRPDVPATLAMVVDTATAKDVRDRYADESELVADLERVLATERRGGSDDEQITTVLPPLRLAGRRVRGRRRLALLAALPLIAVAALLTVLLGTPTHPGSGTRTHRPPVSEEVKLCRTCAYAYNPDGNGGTAQNNTDAHFAVDGVARTAWTTETYYTGQLGKAGVGIYVSTQTGTTASKLVVDTSTPGWDATIYASHRQPDANSFSASGWVRVGGANYVSATQPFELDTGNTRYDHFLIWITRLAKGRELAAVNEIRLYRR
jgi:eukaryotic-like serine/threonine-protein kinase